MFFQDKSKQTVYAVGLSGTRSLSKSKIGTLEWLLKADYCKNKRQIAGPFVGPRKEILTPWSTCATESARNCNVFGIVRIEKFEYTQIEASYDPMLQAMFSKINQKTLVLDKTPDPILYITEIEIYNQKEGLALSQDEIDYLKGLSKLYNRPLTDSEIFGFGQANSEHCRHKIFNGTFVIDGVKMEDTLFNMIKKTTKSNPGRVVSAYTDNCALLGGPDSWRFTVSKEHCFVLSFGNLLITIKAETHNFPTTVCAFPGAATGTGGEIRDRMAAGQGSTPIAGTATYMTAYPRFHNNQVRSNMVARNWLYQDPIQILVQASNGASDYGNKFGQPLINGSVLTFEHERSDGTKYGYDKVIMQAGGIGTAYAEHLNKGEPQAGDLIILLGGDNYLIGMGGGSVSSVDTGHYIGKTELNAVQRANPEMQKRVYNVVRTCNELGDKNPIISIHDHGAGGHINCFSEIVGDAGGIIYINRLPIGDETLSFKEIIGNESQERMALLIKPENLDLLQKIADTEKSPMFCVGEITGNGRFVFKDEITGETPFDLPISDMFGNPPKTVISDVTLFFEPEPLSYHPIYVMKYLWDVLRMESAASKDYLISKVDRSVTGLVAQQQCVGPLQLPLADFGAIATDYVGNLGVAISTGHSPVVSLIDVEAGVKLALVEALTNLVGVPLKHGILGVSCSANWMWPCKNLGEDARLFKAVKALSEFAIRLGINIPTGKDSLSATQKYPDGTKVLAPGTVIISATAEISDVRKIVNPVFKSGYDDSKIIRIDFSLDKLKLGGSTLAQTLFQLGDEVPIIQDDSYVAWAFTAIQKLISKGLVLAAHDVSADGLVPTLLEMCFADNRLGADIDLDVLNEPDLIKCYFANNPAVILQIKPEASQLLSESGIKFETLGKLSDKWNLVLRCHGRTNVLSIDELRSEWFSTSYNLDRYQSNPETAAKKFETFAKQPLTYNLPYGFTGKLSQYGISPIQTDNKKVRAAIIREKGSNGDREMAWAMHLAGFEVRDIHMSMLISGEETLEDVQFIAFVGGFSNSDVLGSARGWAGSFKYNKRAKKSLEKFYARDDTLSFGVCNGCQLMVLLNLINPNHEHQTELIKNRSNRFESNFVGVNVGANPGIMLSTLEDSQLGIWVAHGEGRFSFPYSSDCYNIALKYSYHDYPANPNGSEYDAAAIVSDDGRHLATMPHPERCLRKYNCGYYPEDRADDEITPWVEIFINAYDWCLERKNNK